MGGSEGRAQEHVGVAGGNEGAASFADCLLGANAQLQYQQLCEALSNFLDLSRPCPLNWGVPVPTRLSKRALWILAAHSVARALTALASLGAGRNADSLGLLQTSPIRICTLRRSQGDSCVHWSLREDHRPSSAATPAPPPLWVGW